MKKRTKKSRVSEIEEADLFQSVNSLSVGDISLSSNVMRMEELIDGLVFILKNEEVKKYLDVQKSKKMFNGLGSGGDYFG